MKEIQLNRANEIKELIRDAQRVQAELISKNHYMTSLVIKIWPYWKQDIKNHIADLEEEFEEL